MDKIINYVSVSLVPIAGCVISLLTYINSLKKKNIDKEVNRAIAQQNTQGDNFHYEDNRTTEVNVHVTSLESEKERISIRQQNIDYTSKIIAKYSFWFFLIIYISNLYKLLLPLPNAPFITFDTTQPSLLGFLATTLYQAILPTMINTLLLTGIICLILAFKAPLHKRNFVSLIMMILNLAVASLYFYCMSVVRKIPINTIKMAAPNGQELNLNAFLQAMLPYIILVLALILWAVSTMLIKVLFETEYSRPNLKLFKVAIPRIGFYFFLIAFPIFIILATKYI